MLGVIGALIAAAAPAPADGLTWQIVEVRPAEALERAAACGLGPAAVRFDDELQSYVLSVADAVSATDEQLSCLDGATEFGMFVELPEDLQRRFDALRDARASAMMKAQARMWLAQRKMLERVPDYVPGKTDDAAFAKAIERLCGPHAEGALGSFNGSAAISPDWIATIGMPPRKKKAEALSCLLNVASVAGFELGLIGNEAYRP